jgi:hypothetical protein
MLIRTALCVVVAASAGLSADWKPVDPAEIALRAPKVQKDAHAEALLWEVWVSDDAASGYPRSVLSHYLKVKIFDQAGAEMMIKIDLPYLKAVRIYDIAGRTTKADGSSAELKKDGVFERTVLKANGVQVKVKSLAMPAVEPGAIIEYRWKERHEEQLADYIELQLQRDIPVQWLRYHLKPLIHPMFPFTMRALTFQPPQDPRPFEKESNGFYGISYSNIPAFKEEPHMPPEHEVRGWMLVYYAPDSNLTPEKYWKVYGKEEYERIKPRLKIDNEVRRTAERVIEGATDPEEKLRRLFRYCRNSIQNFADAGSELNFGDRKDRKENRSPADTIRQGAGTSLDIDLLFAALATSAGYDARFAKVADRGQFFFSANSANSYFLRTYDIAVKVNGQWRFFDPASTYHTLGMLRWQEEGSPALICGPTDSEIVSTPLSSPEKSKRSRRAVLRLADDGTIEGVTHLEYTGHAASSRRADYQGRKPEEREQEIIEILKNQYHAPEIDGVRFLNLNDPEKPLIVEYHIRIAGYAQRTGKRLFFQPAFFQKNLDAMFPASERKYPVYFSYPWTEADHVTITIPNGFEMDNADVPPSTSFGEAGAYSVNATWNAADRVITYTRELKFGANGHILFPQKSYSAVKSAFDIIHQCDQHVITLKQTVTN